MVQQIDTNNNSMRKMTHCSFFAKNPLKQQRLRETTIPYSKTHHIVDRDPGIKFETKEYKGRILLNYCDHCYECCEQVCLFLEYKQRFKHTQTTIDMIDTSSLPLPSNQSKEEGVRQIKHIKITYHSNGETESDNFWTIEFATTHNKEDKILFYENEVPLESDRTLLKNIFSTKKF